MKVAVFSLAVMLVVLVFVRKSQCYSASKPSPMCPDGEHIDRAGVCRKILDQQEALPAIKKEADETKVEDPFVTTNPSSTTRNPLKPELEHHPGIVDAPLFKCGGNMRRAQNGQCRPVI